MTTKKCPKCGATVPIIFDTKTCPFCMAFLDEKDEQVFLKEYEKRQQLDLAKLEIIHGKKYADDLRKQVEAGESSVSVHLGEYDNLSLEELKRTFGGKAKEENMMKDAEELAFNGKFEQAFDLINQALTINPMSSEACFIKGKISIALGDFENALEYLRRAKEFGMRGNLIELYGITAFSYNSNFKKPNLSPDHLEEVKIRIAPFADYKLWTSSAADYQMLGHYEEAYKSYHKALSLNKSYSVALKNIKIIESLSQ